MHVARIHVRGFRNHSDTALEFGDGTNIILGDNGQGKTNILEAISYLCLTKSFYASGDAVVLGLGKESFEVEGQIISDTQSDSQIRVAYLSSSREKIYSVGRRRIEPLSSIIGRFPIVILSPEHAPITTVPPSGRRRFVDLLMSQSSTTYFEDLLEYRRILKQRNAILLEGRLAKSAPWDVLEAWNEQLVRVGAGIMHKRAQFIEQFTSYITSSYREIVEAVEEPVIEYVLSGSPVPEEQKRNALSKEDLEEILLKGVEERRREELRLGTTLVGPHRDEFAMKLNGLDLRKFASQGQHKTFLVALKIGEFFYLQEQRRETPILLLDDVFSELDDHRARCVLSLIGGLSQTVVTSTSGEIFDSAMSFNDHNRKFLVSNGTVVYESV